MILGDAEADVAVFAGFEPQDLFERFARNEDREIRRSSCLAVAALREIDQRHAMAVGGDHLHLRRLNFEQRAVELEARLFVRDRELHFRDHRLQFFERDVVRLGRVHRRQRRIVLGGQSEEAELRGAGLDQQRVVFLQRDVHVVVGKRADDVEEPFRFDRHAAGRRDARGAGAEDRDVEIRRGDLQPAVGGRSSTFDRIGIVERFSTTPWQSCSSF